MRLDRAAVFLGICLLGAAAYPATPREGTVDTYFGVTTPDPYRWLEQITSPRVRDWAAAQNRLAVGSLDRLASHNRLSAMARTFSNFPGDTVPNGPGQVYVWDQPLPGAHMRELVVEVGSSQKRYSGSAFGMGANAALVTWILSPNRDVVAYGVETSGDGWIHWHFLRLANGRPFPDVITGIPDWAPTSWARNSSGLYYGGYPSEAPRTSGEAVGQGYRAMFHRLGSRQSTDTLIYRRDDASELPYARETSDGTYVIAGSNLGSTAGNSILVRETSAPDAPLRIVFPKGAATYAYVTNHGPTAFFRTDDRASRGKLVSVNLETRSGIRDVIPETGAILQDVTVSGERFVATYLRDGYNELAVFSRNGKRLRVIPLPGRGTASFTGHSTTSQGTYSFSTFSDCWDTFAYDTATGAGHKISGFKQMLASGDYVTDELFAQSTNGARVPIFVTYRKGLKRNGASPTLLTGYGGFGSVTTPQCFPLSTLWLAMGGVFAYADVRGGGEYGEAWHHDGMRGKKQHVFDDFAAAARLLVADGYASRSTLGAYGYSGGGVMVGVTEVEHPELFGAVVEGAGPLDVLRGYTYGSESAWAGEVGSPIASPEQFQWLAAYAPLLKIARGTRYPATLILASAKDATVSPAHSYKFAAALQYAQAGDEPILLRVPPSGGHAGNTAFGDWDAAASATSFLWSHLASASGDR